LPVLARSGCLLASRLPERSRLDKHPHRVKCYDSVRGTIYDYGALTIDGDEYIPFRKYAGKMVLFVNYLGKEGTALGELNALQNELGPYGLVVLGFPSNQFGKQEPGQNSEILPALKYVRPGGGFVPNFQLFQKGDVNGAKEQKVYSFLKNSCPPVAEEFGNPKNLFWEPLRNHDIKWNFEKFLVGPDGVPVMRWYHRANIATVKNDIVAYMRRQRGH
uniref:glutathione peroxidase n=1 Tax=Anser cygnoides TaxID=8845 RepID=A0A8B9D2C3_ANSCY